MFLDFHPLNVPLSILSKTLSLNFCFTSGSELEHFEEQYVALCAE